MSVRVLVCGGRDYINSALVTKVLDKVHAHFGTKLCIVNGGATGADQHARYWCAARGVACITLDAAWTYYQKRAGMVRNAWTLKHTRPQYVIAFPGGKGTANMCRLAEKKKVPVYRYQ